MAFQKETIGWIVELGVIIVLLQYIRISEANCPAAPSASTDDNFYYRYLPSPPPVTHVEFMVRAQNDVHISLAPSRTMEGPLYEIVIGGWENTQSAIRRCSQCDNVVEVHTPGILGGPEIRPFLITYYRALGKISVYRNGEPHPFMSWTDPQPFAATEVGYSTGWGSHGEFKFCNLEGCAAKPTYPTNDNYHYRYLPAQLKTRVVQFAVMAHHDVHIALSPAKANDGAMYEIVLGAWENTRSVIRKCKQCRDEIIVASDGVVSPVELRGFMIVFNPNGHIGVYKSGQRTPFMSWVDPNPIPIYYLGYSTGFGSSGEFKFCNID